MTDIWRANLLSLTLALDQVPLVQCQTNFVHLVSCELRFQNDTIQIQKLPIEDKIIIYVSIVSFAFTILQSLATVETSR